MDNQPQNNNSAKWIALSVLILFVLSGGVYRLAKHRGDEQKPSSSSSSTSPSAVAQKGAQNGAHVSGSGATVPATPGTAPVTGQVAMAPGAPAAANPSSAPQSAAPVAPANECFTITYRHRQLATHNDDEACSHHKNLLRLKASNISSQSVCVRVNGTPVHYLSVKGHSDELIFGSVAGPKSKVTVSYCTGKECAKADCTVPKDEFMEAIGGAEGNSANAKLGQWDPDAPGEKEADVMAKLDGEVKKELENNDDLNGRAPAGEMFKDWIGEVQTSACGTQQAQN